MRLAGCKASGAQKLIEEKLKAEGTPADKLASAADRACVRVRDDDGGQHAVEVDGDYTETLARLSSNMQAIGYHDCGASCRDYRKYYS